MHATQSELGGRLDLLSMYLIASFAAAYALMRLVGQGSVFFFQVFLMLVAACELVGTVDGSVPVVHDSGNLAFGTLLVTAIVDRGACSGAGARAPAPTCAGAAARWPRCWSPS